MTTQMRLSPHDNRLYSVARDIVHNWKPVMEHIAGVIDDQRWKELQEVLDAGNISHDEVGEALSCFMIYNASAAVKSPDNNDMLTALQTSGFLACKPLAQVAVMALIGQAYAGIQFAGIRDACLGTDKPLLDIQELVKAADEIRGRKRTLLSKLWRVLKDHFK
jgi:hypothetical protein